MSVHIHVRDTGEGEPVLLLHGWPDTGALWRNQVPALVEAGYLVIVPDLRGFGASDKAFSSPLACATSLPLEFCSARCRRNGLRDKASGPSRRPCK